jgi:hypothetical protein
MKVLLIDDMRSENHLRDVGMVIMPTMVARTYEDAIYALTKLGPFDLVYLDHDLGDDDMDKTGYSIMCFLEENTQYLPGQIEIVSSNPVGRKNMKVVIDRLYK